MRDIGKMERKNASDLLQLMNSKWCWRERCGTCGNQDYRREIKALMARLEVDPTELLVQIDPLAFQFQPNWGNGMAILFEELHLRKQEMDSVLSAWLNRDPLPVRLMDEVLYYLSPTGEIGMRWLDRSIRSAITSDDTSLIETLLLKLEVRVHHYPDLVEKAFAKKRESKSIRRLLKRIGGWDYLP